MAVARPLQLLVFVAAAAVSALVAILVISMPARERVVRKDAEPATSASVRHGAARDTRDVSARTVPPRPVPHLAAEEPAVHTAARPALNPAELERNFPGLGRAYQEEFERAQARSENRLQRRCLAALPDSVRELRWDTIESFEPSSDGKYLVRTSIEVVPKTPEQSPFAECLADGVRRADELRIEIPEGVSVDGVLEVRNGGIVFINDMTADEITQEVLSLRRRVADRDLSDERRTVLQDQLELFECYEQRGLARRRECLAR